MPFKFKLGLWEVQLLTHKSYGLISLLNDEGISDVWESRSGLIQSCNYAIEDAQSAIDNYKSLTEAEFLNRRYLTLYGLFQAFFVQQDAMKTLFSCCLQKAIDFKRDYPKLYNIREIRNITIGHPTDRKKEYFLISQITLKKEGYYLVAHNKDDEKKGKDITVYPNLVRDQENGMLQLFEQFELGVNQLILQK